jgi:hypothetical protein
LDQVAVDGSLEIDDALKRTALETALGENGEAVMGVSAGRKRDAAVPAAS